MLQLTTAFCGIIGVYKPSGLTSHRMVNLLRTFTGEKRIGHAGTLDPAASGVMIMAIGKRFTKQLSQHIGGEKEYLVEITLGASSTTDDQQGVIIPYEGLLQIPPQEVIESALTRFIGHIWQVPPKYSAVKVQGKEAYKYSYQGESVILKPRLRHIKLITVLEYSWPLLKLKVITGPGVYIRSLARDLGAVLEVGGYVSSLVRTRVGEYTLSQCYVIPDTRTDIPK